MPQTVVRRATAGDAGGIAHVHVLAWQEAYAGQLPAEVLDGLEEEPRAQRWASIIGDDATDVFVAEVDGHVVGWAAASEGRDVEAPEGRELEGIYVLRQVYGSDAAQLSVLGSQQRGEHSSRSELT